MDDPRILFAVLALHYMAEADASLEPREIEGLKMVLEAVLIDGRTGNDRLQKSR